MKRDEVDIPAISQSKEQNISYILKDLERKNKYMVNFINSRRFNKKETLHLSSLIDRKQKKQVPDQKTTSKLPKNIKKYVYLHQSNRLKSPVALNETTPAKIKYEVKERKHAYKKFNHSLPNQEISRILGKPKTFVKFKRKYFDQSKSKFKDQKQKVLNNSYSNQLKKVENSTKRTTNNTLKKNPEGSFTRVVRRPKKLKANGYLNLSKLSIKDQKTATKNPKLDFKISKTPNFKRQHYRNVSSNLTELGFESRNVFFASTTEGQQGSFQNKELKRTRYTVQRPLHHYGEDTGELRSSSIIQISNNLDQFQKGKTNTKHIFVDN